MKLLCITDQKTCQAYHDLGLFTLDYDFLMDDDGTWGLSESNASGTGSRPNRVPPSVVPREH